MQDIHSTHSSGGGGRLFVGGGDRRLRPHHHHDLKCPRCDSSNTKFCYYNNYNLSQPRHFCKTCRRYWTNGGVLRNVPVGGGIRKAKRSSKQKSKTSSISSSATVVTASPSDLGLKSSNSENSSSDSCSRTATTTTTATPMTTAELSGSNSTNSTRPMLRNFNESSVRFFNFSESSAPMMTVDPVESCGGNVSSEIGTFRSLMRSWTDELPFGVDKKQNEIQKDVKMAENWEDNVDDEGLFDQSYWTQNQWNDGDHQLLNYLP